MQSKSGTGFGGADQQLSKLGAVHSRINVPDGLCAIADAGRVRLQSQLYRLAAH
jgi:hypothetical protein